MFHGWGLPWVEKMGGDQTNSGRPKKRARTCVHTNVESRKREHGRRTDPTWSDYWCTTDGSEVGLETKQQ